jgi:hypothetical protein
MFGNSDDIRRVFQQRCFTFGNDCGVGNFDPIIPGFGFFATSDRSIAPFS